MILFGMACFLLLSVFIPMMAFGGTLIFMIVYIWSRFTPDQPVSLMGVVKLKAFYLPWVLLLMTKVMGGSPIPDLIGILVGHLYYFLKVLYPNGSSPDLLQTPKFLSDYIQNLYGGFGYVNPNYQAPRAAPTAFRGRGHRLGAD